MRENRNKSTPVFQQTTSWTTEKIQNDGLAHTEESTFISQRFLFWSYLDMPGQSMLCVDEDDREVGIDVFTAG